MSPKNCLVVLSLLIMMAWTHPVNAISPIKYSIIAIEYSETCQKLLDSKSDSSCPPVKELMKYDTSNTKISGQFVMKKDGSWARTNPQSLNHVLFYTDPNDVKVCVDCKINLPSSDVIQTIFIEPSGFSYLKHNFSTEVIPNVSPNSVLHQNSIDASLTVYYDRYVDEACHTANMDYSPSLMNDTILYLKSGCTKTNFNKTSTSLIPNTSFTFNNPYSSLHMDAYLQSIFHGHKSLTNEKMPTIGGLGPGNCINTKCNYKDPNAKW